MRLSCYLSPLIPALLCPKMTSASIDPAVSYSTYLAPYHASLDPEYPPVPDSYIVMLRDGYKLEDHFAFIGIDLSQTEGFMRINTISAYAGKFSKETVHEKIRRDPGVKLVEEDKPAYLIDELMDCSSLSPS